jgi:ABC-type phosphate transport system substrate-binding protein
VRTLRFKRAAGIGLAVAAALTATLATASPVSAASTTHPGVVIAAAGSDTTEALMNNILNPGQDEYNIAAQQKTALTVPSDGDCATQTYNGNSRMAQDGNVTSGSTTVTSATANFAVTDVGHFIVGTGIPANATIASVTNSTTAVISANATANSNPANTTQLTIYSFGPGGGTVISPNGSGAGRNALRDSVGAAAYPANDGKHGCIDIARSSGEPRAVGAGNDNATFEYYAYALDVVEWMSPSLNAPAAMTLSQLQGIYNCTITNWNQLPGGGNGQIQRVMPQSSSGTGDTFIKKVLGGANPFSVSNGSCPAVIAVEENHGNDPALNGTPAFANAILPYSGGKWKFQADFAVNPTVDLRNGVRPGAIYMDGTGADRSTATYPVSWTGSSFFLNTAAVTEAAVPVSPSNYPGVRYLYNVLDNTSPSFGTADSLVGFTGSANSPLCTPFPGAGNKRSVIRSAGFLELSGASQTASTTLGGVNPSTSCRLNPVSPPPTATINQAAGQADPVTGAQAVTYTVTFSQSVTGLDNGDFTNTGTATGSVTGVTGSGSGPYTVTFTATSTGTVILAVKANAAVNTFGAGSLASTSTDNTITIN